jgi:hypothetical protein
LSFDHQCPEDAGVFGRQCHGGDVLTAALAQLLDPTALRIVSLWRMAHCRACAVHQQRSEVDIAAFTDAKQPVLAPGGILFGHQAQPGGALTAILELGGMCHGGHERRGGEPSDAFLLP